MERYYENSHSNVHRGVYVTAEEATALYERARMLVGHFIGSARPDREVVFTKNATESINLVAQSWGRSNLVAGDVVVLTEMEHHSNMVPWLQLAQEKGVELRYIPIDGAWPTGPDQSRSAGGRGQAGRSLTAMSNVLGTINPLAQITEVAHQAGALVLADGAQSVPHMPTNVQALGVDFLAFSAHKMMGPTGIGVLWGRQEVLESMPPFMGGGGMILDVRLDRFLPAEPPDRFEAGTPPIAEAVGLGAAVEYLTELSMARLRAHEQALTTYALDTLADELGDDVPGLRSARW